MPKRHLIFLVLLIGVCISALIFYVERGVEKVGAPPENVLKVEIDYRWTDGWAAINHFYEIDWSNEGYVSDNDIFVNAKLIADLRDSLDNLLESGGLKSGLSHWDDYPWFKIEILFDNGDIAILESDSNCYNMIPWNVSYGEKLYAQYSGEIPDALFPILNQIDPESWLEMPGFGDPPAPLENMLEDAERVL